MCNVLHTPRHLKVKMLKTRDKEKILKEAVEKNDTLNRKEQ